MQRYTRLMLAVASTILMIPMMPAVARAQGVTTGSIGGTVTGGGTALEGANIRIVDPSTGFARTVQTRTGGRYIISGLEVGDYRVSATAIGYQPRSLEGVHVSLAQTARADFAMSEAAVALAELTVRARADASDIAPTRTGAQTYITDSLVSRLPTLNRQMQDFAKLSPQVTINPGSRGDLSAAGQNNRFNAIQVDGTTQNDRFGLGATGELGGQANGRGITLEAVKEYQIVLSPYNVTQGGFTGALINAVTKNGTNDLKATAFYTYRNQGLASGNPFIANTKFNIKQYGGSLGGPIIKDKLHFFVAGELQSSLKPAAGPYLGQTGVTGANAVRVDQATVDAFNTALAAYGIVGGSGAQQDDANPISNLVGRLDWQVSNKDRMVFREIYDNSHGDDFSRSSSVFALTSNRFKRSEHANSVTAQLFSSIGNAGSNELQLGWVNQRFARTFDQIAPQVSLVNIASPTVPGQTVTLRAGPDSSSHINQLDQDFFELRDDYTFAWRGNSKHMITIGTRSDDYKIRDAFWQNKFGSWAFTSLANLQAGIASAYAVGVGIGDPVAHFSALNLAFYGQDQWSASPNLNLTMGLRAEGPVFLDKPSYQAAVETDFGRRTDQVPSNITWSPRLGFNWNVHGTGVTQVRGGIGFFAGIEPYVWLTNVFANNGVNGVAQFTCSGGSTPPPPTFTTATAANAPQNCNGVGPTTGTNIGAVNTVDPDFKQPRVLRATLGMDHQLGHGLVGTFDAVYTKSFDSPFLVNLELPDPVTTDGTGRVMYGTLAANGRATTAFRHGTKYSGADFDLQNSSADYAYSVSGGLTKRFSGSWEGSVFYTYGRSYSVQDFTSSVARSNFLNGRITSGNQFDQTATVSAFDRPNHISAAITYTAPWKKFPTDISFIYVGQSGTTFAYVYGAGTGLSGTGDLNADGLVGNDPVYIPSNATDPNVVFESYTGAVNGGASHTISASEQADSLQSLINQTPCLAAQRGKIMQRDSCRNPWFNTLDMSIKQTLPSLAGHKLSVQADVYNFLNLLNSSWGQYRQNSSFNNVTFLQHRGESGANTTMVRFDPSLAVYDVRFPKVLTANNYWQAQVTLRYAY